MTKEQEEYANAVWEALHDSGTKADVDAAREALEQSDSYNPHGGWDSPSDDDYSPGSTVRDGKITGFDYGNKVSSEAIQNYVNANDHRMTDQALGQAGNQMREAILRELEVQQQPTAVGRDVPGTPQSAAQEALKQQKAAQLEAELAKLKTAYKEDLQGYDEDAKKLQAQYDKSVAGYENRRDQLRAAYEQNLAGYQDASNRLGQTYDAARNRAAAQSAQGQRAFDERAAALGLGTGPAGQAALSRESTLQTALSGVDQAQDNAQADIDLRVRNLGTELSQQESNIDLQLSNLAAQLGISRAELDRAVSNLNSRYHLAEAQAQANSDAAIAQALYEQLLREQSQERADQKQTQAWEREDQLRQEQWARQDAQQTQADAKARIDTFLKAGGALDQLSPDLIAQSGYTQTELNALESYYQGQTAAANSPTTILDTMRSFGDDNAAKAFLYGKGYSKDTTNTLWNLYLNGQATSAVNPNTIVTNSGNRTPSRKTGYDNGGLTSDQVKQLQTYYGLTPDGFWGPNSQKTTGKTAREAWGEMLDRNAEMDFDRVSEG